MKILEQWDNALPDFNRAIEIKPELDVALFIVDTYYLKKINQAII